MQPRCQRYRDGSPLGKTYGAGLSITKPSPGPPLVLFFVLNGTARRVHGPASEGAWCTQLPHGPQAQGHMPSSPCRSRAASEAVLLPLGVVPLVQWRGWPPPCRPSPMWKIR